MVELEVVDIVMEQLSEEEERRNWREGAQVVGAPPKFVSVGAGVAAWIRLKERDGDRVLSISIGPCEATAIALATQGVTTPRPQTHDFICSLFGALDDVSVASLILTKRDQKTFFAELEVVHGNRRIKVDCRPSDGIAAAIRLGIPILAAPALDPEFEAAA
jgi:bifunctional DNase/RNase